MKANRVDFDSQRMVHAPAAVSTGNNNLAWMPANPVGCGLAKRANATMGARPHVQQVDR
jgi:hypothetical protein